jgi:site-specific recombinase XerD
MKIEKFRVLLYLKKSSPDKSGKAPIMGRVTVNRSMAQFSCKLSCTPDPWNPRESRLNGKSNEAVETNAKIDKLLLAVNAAFDSLVERKQEFDAEAVKNLFQGSMWAQMTLLALFDREMEWVKSRIGIDRAPATITTWYYARRSLGAFVKKKFKTKDIAFGQLNEQFIREYQDFVLGAQGYSMDTLRHYLAFLKRICRIAFKEGHSDKQHFAHYKLPKQKETTPKALSREDFEKIRDLEIARHRRSHIITRDLFLFACYTGTAYADVVSITTDNLFTDDEGRLWLKYHRKKTDYRARVKLLPEAIALLEKYKDDSRDTLFPVQHYQTLRSNMKSLRIMADISQDLVYHLGRHSFASLVTLEEGVPIETISRMLGHSNIATTQIYARVTPAKLFEDMDRFIEATADMKLVL